jgi:hypothetical protein
MINELIKKKISMKKIKKDDKKLFIKQWFINKPVNYFNE